MDLDELRGDDGVYSITPRSTNKKSTRKEPNPDGNNIIPDEETPSDPEELRGD